MTAGEHWFEPIARFMGPAYLRYSFTKGTDQEVAALIDLLGLQPGERVLDVGCGPGRHALALAAAGMDVIGLDISAEWTAIAAERAAALSLSGNATFITGDARSMVDGGPMGEAGGFDAVISLCQGAFGLAGGPGDLPALSHRELDEPILEMMARALRPGGRLAVSAFSAYFQLRYLEDQDTFDATSGVNHETTVIRNEAGDEQPAELWTTCFTPRELRLLARATGLEVDAIYGVTPGAYGPHPASIDCPEFLLLARLG